MVDDKADRRRYPRIQAPVYCRPAGWLESRRPPLDIGPGGARILGDVEVSVGDRLSLDLIPPNGSPLNCLAKVAWVAELPEGSEAKYEIGLQFIDVRGQDITALLAVLER